MKYKGHSHPYFHTEFIIIYQVELKKRQHVFNFHADKVIDCVA